MITKLEMSENKRDRITSGLNELKIMKIDTKKLKEVESQLMSLKEKERMVRFKIKEIKELEIKLKKLKLKELIFKILELVCENVIKTLLLKTKNDTKPILIKSLVMY